MWVAGAQNVTSPSSTLAYSFDGIFWTTSSSITSILNHSVRAVAWGGNVWVAVGLGSTASVAYSYDGMNWIKSDTAYAINTDVYALAWNGTMWLAANNRMMRSYDGITWTMILSTLPTYNGAITKLATNGRIWLWGSGGNSAYIAAYSIDGLNWSPSNITTTNFPATNYNIGVSDFAWNGSIWVVILGSGNPLGYSSDGGMSWVAASNGSTQISIYGNSITWNGSVFIAGSYGSDAAISTDGDYWTSGSFLKLDSLLPYGVNGGGILIKSRIPLPYITSYIDNTMAIIDRQVTSKFCVAGQDNKFAYSYDGVVWYRSPSVSISGTIRSIAFNGSMWVAVTVNGGNTNSMAYSYNGITWALTSSGSAILNFNIYGVAWGGNIWVAVGASSPGGRGLIYSYDGINWTLSTSANGFSQQYECVAWNGTMWLAAPNNDRLLYSTDGINWAIAVSSTSTNISAIATNGRMWVWGSYNGNISYSYDGFNWFPSTTVTGNNMVSSILWNGSAWLITTTTNITPILYSTNGTSWTAQTSKFTNGNYTRGITWNGSVWLVGGDGNSAGCAISTDGTNWATCKAVEDILSTGSIYFASRSPLPMNAITSGATAYFPSTSIIWAPTTVPKNVNAGIDSLLANVSSIRITRYLYGSGTTSSGTLAITFSTAFANTPNVTATISGSTAGFINVSSITALGFTVNTYNISGVATNYTFNWHAVL
jgi:hypothetical protein